MTTVQNILENGTNKEKLQHIVNTIGWKEDKVSIFAADKVYTDLKEYYNSPELAAVHSGFQSISYAKRSFDHAGTEFKASYVVGTKMYNHYKADGINFIQEETIGSSLDNAGLMEVLVTPLGFVVDGREAYGKGEANRKIWRQQDWVTLTSVYTS